MVREVVARAARGRAARRTIVPIELIKTPAPRNGRERYVKPVRPPPAVQEEIIPASIAHGRFAVDNDSLLTDQEGHEIIAAYDRVADQAFNSDFPSLSSNAPHPQSNSQSTWAMPVRPMGQARRPEQGMGGPPPSQARQQVQQQQDEFLSSSSQLPSSQAGFRYGGQNPVGRASQQEGSADDFPALRNAGGEIGQDRGLQGGTYGLSEFGGFSPTSLSPHHSTTS